MRMLKAFVLLCVVSTTISAQGFDDRELSISISSESVSSDYRQFRVGLVVKNISRKQIALVQSNFGGHAELDYAIYVTRKDGSPSVESEYSRSLVGQGHQIILSRPQVIRLAPGQTLEDHFYLDKLIDLRPGTYLVQAALLADRLGEEPRAKSDVLEIPVR